MLRQPAGFLLYVPANQCGVSRRLRETGLRLVKPWKLEYPEKNTQSKTKIPTTSANIRLTMADLGRGVKLSCTQCHLLEG